MGIKHAKQSGLPPDEGNPAHVEPTDWYADHTGSNLTAADEGTSLDTAVTSLDFTGAGVTASAVGHAVTVDVPGGGSLTNWTTYDCVWSSDSDPQPSLGSGLLNGRYFSTPNLDGTATVDIEIEVDFAVDTTYGNGIWRFSIPVIGPNTITLGHPVGSLRGQRGGAPLVGVVWSEHFTTFVSLLDATGDIGSASGAWAFPDSLRMSMRYHAIPPD